MMRYSRHAGFIVGWVAFLTMTSGCSSGRIRNVQVSDDGRILAFQYNQTWPPGGSIAYVVDSAGVQSTEIEAPFVLDPKGRWLLLLPCQASGVFGLDGRLVLLSLETRTRYETRLPFDVSWDYINVAIRSSEYKSAETGSAPSALQLSGVTVVFKDRPEILIGPLPPEDRYWRWDAQANWADEWRCISPQEADDCRTPDHAVRRITWGENYSLVDYTVEMPSDGFTALRTIWVRPDGSTLELTRKNDAPFCFLVAGGVTLLCGGAALLSPFFGAAAALSGTESFPSATSSAFGTSGMFMCMCWGSAFADLEVDPQKLQQAREELRRKVEERRKPAAAKDETHAVNNP